MANLTIKSVIIKEKQVLLFDQHSSLVVYKVLLKCTLCQFTMGPYWVIVSVSLEYSKLAIKQSLQIQESNETLQALKQTSAE